ncbi:hypothetical protein [Frankia sp. CiP3]|uniref:hypothetical protein n=1 Tax=Frankia sp. CiP3 TaxID=2880971 RepID=UPI001EF662CF|nr:hypothetical protein [Frankia sp. CiP3]
MPAAEATLHAPGPAGESTYQVISRTPGAAFARRYFEAWRSTARRRPILLHTPITSITAVKPGIPAEPPGSAIAATAFRDLAPLAPPTPPQ